MRILHRVGAGRLLRDVGVLTPPRLKGLDTPMNVYSSRYGMIEPALASAGTRA